MTVTVITGEDEQETVTQEEVSGEIVENVSEDAVTIAAINADRDVEIAEIVAKTQRKEIETRHAAEMARLTSEIEEWRTKAETAALLNTEMREQLSILQASMMKESQEPEAQVSNTEPNPQEPVAEEVMQDSLEAEKAPPEPERKQPHLRWI